MSDVSNGEGYVCVEVEGKQEISVPSSQFCFKPKTTLKFKVFKKERERENKSTRFIQLGLKELETKIICLCHDLKFDVSEALSLTIKFK